ncbi:restriction endonuclease subunit S [Listeria booriae]|uniref:restriction endonuclease subunit S n=1 Tax=Listeria booriae TaxID=1552123 RepID=UPI001627ACE9|nr:restriction endonuclease subunit S [Listeria booriae]MBC1890491.1 hypothetical protein [Listeria booriae]
MSDKKRNVPVLRFNGFSDAWEQRKLGELGKVTTGKAFSSIDFDEQGEYLVITNKDISTSSRSQNVVTDRINVSDKNIIEKYNLNGKNILVTMDGVNLGKTAMYSNENALLAQRVGRIQSTQLEFVYQITSSNNFFMTMRTLSVGNAIKHISLSQISNYSTLVPNNEAEQQKIGELFKHLDNTIALHQRKLDALKQMKKGFLQQLLPESGEKLPRVRFTGFQEEWEQREFGDVLIFSVPNNNFPRASLNYEEGIIKNIHYGDVLMKFDSVVDVSTSNIPFVTNGQLESFTNQFLQNGDIVIADTAEDKITGKAIEVCGINNTSVVSGLHTMVARPNISFASRYLGYYLNSYSYRKQLLPLMQGIKVLSISKSNISKTTLCFPKNAIEQERIGDFFKQLDKTMLLHQNRLTKLTTLKKAYLKIMFI